MEEGNPATTMPGRQEIRLNEPLQRLTGVLYCYEDELVGLLLRARAYIRIDTSPDKRQQRPLPPAPAHNTQDEGAHAVGQRSKERQDDPAAWDDQFAKSRFSPTTVADDLKSLQGTSERQSLMFLCFTYSDPTSSLPEEVAILLDDAGMRM